MSTLSCSSGNPGRFVLGKSLVKNTNLTQDPESFECTGSARCQRWSNCGVASFDAFNMGFDNMKSSSGYRYAYATINGTWNFVSSSSDRVLVSLYSSPGGLSGLCPPPAPAKLIDSTSFEVKIFFYHIFRILVFSVFYVIG